MSLLNKVRVRVDAEVRLLVGIIGIKGQSPQAVTIMSISYYRDFSSPCSEA